MAEENNQQAQPSASDTPASSNQQQSTQADNASLLGATAPATGLTDVPNHPVTPKEEYDFDKRLYTEDGKFNKDGAKEFFNEIKSERDKYEKRILDLRRKVSDGKAPQDKKEYFQDYVPKEEKYMKFFDPTAPGAEEINNIKENLSEIYHEAGLTRRQGDDISHMMLKILENTGVIDARSDEEKYVAQRKWVDEQKRELGSNADNIIREAKLFVENAPIFAAKTKNDLLNMMEKLGAPFISTLHQLKEAYGSGTGGVPVNVSGLGGLPSDLELKQEYLDPKTTSLRREEIIALRSKAGRTGRLMDARV